MWLFLSLFFLCIILCSCLGFILKSDSSSISTKIVIPVAAAVISVSLMTFTVNDYKAVKRYGTTPDTTIIIKNGIADTIIEYRINYKYK